MSKSVDTEVTAFQVTIPEHGTYTARLGDFIGTKSWLVRDPHGHLIAEFKPLPYPYARMAFLDLVETHIGYQIELARIRTDRDEEMKTLAALVGEADE